MDEARERLRDSLSLIGQNNGTQQNSLQQPETTEKIQIPQDHLKITVDVISQKVSLVVPQNVTIGALKERILQEVFLPQNVLVPPRANNMKLFWSHSGGTNKSRPDSEQLADTSGKSRSEIEEELQPDSSFLVKHHGFEADTELPTSVLILRFDIEVWIHILHKPRPEESASGKARQTFNSVLQIPIKDDHVFTMKKGIQAETGLPMERLHLFWKEQELEDYNRPIGRKGFFHHGSRLELLINDWVVHVLTLKGQRFSLGLDPSESVETFQMKVRKKIEGRSKRNRPYASQIYPDVSMDEYILLMHNGATLDLKHNGTQPVSATIAESGITNKCALYLVLRSYTIPPKKDNMMCRKIPNAEHRGISLVQLRGIATRLLMQCKREGWKSTDPTRKDKFISPEEVTLYDLMENYIKPLTHESQCSYVELVASSEQGQIPQFFCSHWWGETVLRFIACLEQHASDREITEHVPYWICAYAINQHDVLGELPVANPKATPFYRAMQLTKGTVSVLDSEARCVHRIWCVFEISLVVNDLKVKRGGNYIYDIYTVARDEHGISKEPSGVIDHVVPCDKRFRRQASFPLETCHKALAVKLEEAAATVEQDKHFILNSIAGANEDDIYAEAPLSHVAYDRLNAILRTKIAEATYCTALQNGDTDLGLFRKALSAAPHGHLVLYVRGCTQFREEAKKLVQILPNTLLHLELDIGFINFQTSDEFAEGLSRLQMLQFLNLIASWCKEMTNAKKLWAELEQLRSLKELQLDFSCCKALSSVDGLGRVLYQLPNLTSLSVSLADQHSVSTLKHFWEGLASATKLLIFDLDLSYTQLKSTKKLGTALRNMMELEDLSLKLEDCNLESIDPIVESFHRETKLSSLRLRLSGNRLLSSLDKFAKTIPMFRQLRYLELDCSYCNAITSLKELTHTLESSSFHFLEQLKLKCVRNRFLDLQNLPCINSKVMPQLTVLDLEFAHCPRVRSAAGLADGFGSFRSHDWESLRLNLEGTAVSEADAMAVCQVLVDCETRASDLNLRFPSCQFGSIRALSRSRQI